MRCQTGIQNRFQNGILASCTKDTLPINVFGFVLLFFFKKKKKKNVRSLQFDAKAYFKNLQVELWRLHPPESEKKWTKAKVTKELIPLSTKILLWYSHSWVSFSPWKLTEPSDVLLTNKTHVINYKIDNMLLLRLQKYCDPLASPPPTPASGRSQILCELLWRGPCGKDMLSSATK